MSIMSTHDYYLRAYRTRGQDPQGEGADTLYEPPKSMMMACENYLHTPTNPTKGIMTSTTTSPMVYRSYPRYDISSPTPTKIMNDARDEYLPRAVGGIISSRDDDSDTILYHPPAAVYTSQYLSRFVVGTSDIQLKGDRNESLIGESSERRKISRGASSTSSSSSSVRTTNQNIREDVRDYRLHPLRSISEDTTIISNNTGKFNDINGSNKSHFLDYLHDEPESSAMSTSSSTKIKNEIVNNSTETKSTRTSGRGMRKDTSSSKSVAMKILCSKILAGYTLTRNHCPVCNMALVISTSSSNEVAECAYCPIGQHRATISEAVQQRIEAITDLTSLSMSTRRTVGGSRADPPSVGEYTNDDNNGITDNIYCDECLSPKCSTTETDVECKACSITNDICIKISQEQGKGGLLLSDRQCLECGNPEMCHKDGSTSCIVCEILLMKVGEVPRRTITVTPHSESQPEEKEKEEESSPLVSSGVAEKASDGMICDAKFYDGYPLVDGIDEELSNVQLPSVFVEEETCDSSPLVGSIDEELRNVQLLSVEEITSSVSSFLVDGINELRDVQLPYVEEITLSVSSFLVDGISELRNVQLLSVEEITSSVSSFLVDGINELRDVKLPSVEDTLVDDGTVHETGIDSINNVSSTTTIRSTKNVESVDYNKSTEFNKEVASLAAPLGTDLPGVGITLGLSLQQTHPKKEQLGTQPSTADVPKTSKVLLRSRRRAHRTKRIGKSSTMHKTRRSKSSSPVVWVANESPSKSWIIEGKGIVESATSTKSDKAVKENKYIETIESIETKVHKAVGVDNLPNKSVIQCPRLVSDINERARVKKEFDYTDFPEPTLAAAAAASTGTANNDAKMMELMKSEHSSKSSRKDSKCILDKLEKIEEQQKRLVIDDYKDESIKLILKELKDIRHQQQMEIYTQHQRELLLQQKIHELEKETVNAGINAGIKIAAAQRTKLSNARAEQGYIDVYGQTLQYKVGQFNPSGVTEDDELTFQTLLSDFSSLGNSTYNVGGVLHRCVIDRCTEAADIGHTITEQLHAAAVDISDTITEQLHGISKQQWLQKVLNGRGFKLDCGYSSAEIKEELIQTVEVPVNSFSGGLVDAVKSVQRCVVWQ